MVIVLERDTTCFQSSTTRIADCHQKQAGQLSQQGSKTTSVAITTLLMPRLQEAEIADMLKARINSGKAASTSQADSKPGVEDDSIFADLDMDGMPSCFALSQLRTMYCTAVFCCQCTQSASPAML